MAHITYIISFIALIANNFSIHKIYDDKIFYNFVSYENELYISSSNGIHKIDESGDNLILFDKSISGPINSFIYSSINFYIQSFRIGVPNDKIHENFQICWQTIIARNTDYSCHRYHQFLSSEPG